MSTRRNFVTGTIAGVLGMLGLRKVDAAGSETGLARLTKRQLVLLEQSHAQSTGNTQPFTMLERKIFEYRGVFVEERVYKWGRGPHNDYAKVMWALYPFENPVFEYFEIRDDGMKAGFGIRNPLVHACFCIPDESFYGSTKESYTKIEVRQRESVRLLFDKMLDEHCTSQRIPEIQEEILKSCLENCDKSYTGFPLEQKTQYKFVVEWTPVWNRLPTTPGTYLVVYDFKSVSMAMWDGSNWAASNEITYWAEIPVPTF